MVPEVPPGEFEPASAPGLEPLGGTHWRKIPEARRAELLEAAQQAYRDDIAWAALPEVSCAWAALNLCRVVPDDLPEGDPRIRTFTCHRCEDLGEIPRRGNTCWFCPWCDRGLRMEAGFWFRAIYRRRGKTIFALKEERARFHRYLRDRDNTVALRNAVNRLLDAEEKKAPAEDRA